MSTSIDFEIFGESLAQIVNAAVAPRISNLRSSKNSLGEAVISWDLLDPGNKDKRNSHNDNVSGVF